MTPPPASASTATTCAAAATAAAATTSATTTRQDCAAVCTSLRSRRRQHRSVALKLLRSGTQQICRHRLLCCVGKHLNHLARLSWVQYSRGHDIHEGELCFDRGCRVHQLAQLINCEHILLTFHLETINALRIRPKNRQIGRQESND